MCLTNITNVFLRRILALDGQNNNSVVVRIGSSGGNILVEPLVKERNRVEIFLVLFLGNILANFPVLC